MTKARDIANGLGQADNSIDEANLKVSNAPTNGFFLSAQSGNTGGITWAEVATGTPTLITMAATDTSTDAHFPIFSSAATGDEEPRTDTGFTYVPTSGTLTAAVLAGAGTGITGLASGNFATAVTLVIKNSAGTALKTIIGAAS
jgi:hypothetical protein